MIINGWNFPDYVVQYVRRTLRERGRLWEGCRPAYEAGTYRDNELTALLAAGVMVPSADPNGGYVAPADGPEGG